MLITTKIAIWSFFAILVLDMCNQFAFFFTGTRLLTPVILLTSWVLFIIMLYFCFSVSAKHSMFKLCIVCSLIKWTVYIFLYSHFRFQKELLTVPLVLIALSEKEDLIIYCKKKLAYFKYVLCFLFILTVIPFIGWYNLSEEPYRFSGIWKFSQNPGYYCVAFMILFRDKNIIVNILFYLLAIYIGAKSAILAGTAILLYSCRISFIRSVRSQRKLTSAMGIGITILLTIFVAYGGLDYFVESLNYHYEKLFSKEITSNQFGSGRVYLNRLAWDEFKRFNNIELMLGKSATSLYDIYEGRERGRWPHNDFMTVLFIYGIFGLILYIYYTLFRPLMYASTDYPWKNVAIVLCIFLLMATNGFYQTPSSYLFLLCYGDLFEKVGHATKIEKIRKVKVWRP